MSATPKSAISVKTVLVTNEGRSFLADSERRPRDVGLSDAIVTAISTSGSGAPIEMLRCDMAGADWSAMERAGALGELESRLLSVADRLHPNGQGQIGVPHVVFTLEEGGRMTAGRMVFSDVELAKELSDSANRARPIPRLMPYQLGGDKDGCHVVVYADKGIQVHSVHPTAPEAAIVQAELTRQGFTKNAVVRASTPVTTLLSDVLEGRFVRQADLDSYRSAAPQASSGRSFKEELSPRPF